MELSLWRACRVNSLDSVLTLLPTPGLDVNWCNPAEKVHSTALHIAARYGHVALVKLFLESCPAINVNKTSHYELTPLQIAAHHGMEEVVKVIFHLFLFFGSCPLLVWQLIFLFFFFIFLF